MRRRMRWISSGTAAAAASSRYRGERKLIARAPTISPTPLARRERAAQRNAERRVGHEQLVAGAGRGERGAPLGDRPLDRRPIRVAHVGDGGGDLEPALRVDEQRVAG